MLVVLGNFALNGQERGNIEVFRATKGAIDALFVTHEVWGHHHIQPALDRCGLPWISLDYARHFTKRLSPRGWLTNLIRLLKASWGLWKTMREHRPTHVHVANPHYFLSVLPALLLTRTPVVYRLGDVPTQHHVLYRLLWRGFIVRRVRTFVCISKYIRRSAIESGVPAHKAQMLYSHPPGRPVPEVPFAIESFAGETVTYVGQIRPHKGVHLFVETALALCREREDVRFLLAGSVGRQDPFALSLLAKVQAAGLQERVRFLGYVDDVPGLLAASDLHVCPSVCEEALGNVVLEAKAAGVPSVVFPSGGLPELIEHGRDGWVCEAPTVDALRGQTARALDMPSLQEVGGEAWASLARLGITKQEFAEAWARVYGVEPIPTRGEVIAAPTRDVE